jgi:NADPH2:quinone reductase
LKAVVLRETGGPEQLVSEETPEPGAGDGQVVVRVRAAGVNFADVLVRQGRYPQPPQLPTVPGSEVAGEVDGRRVMALPRGGGYAEAVAVDEALVVPLPDGASFEEGAGFLLTYLTAWIPLTRQVRVGPGSVVLVHAGSGGVGSAAIQVGLAAGARVVATAGGPEKVAVCRELGAHEVVDYRTEDVAARVREVTGGHGADVVWDPVGGDVFDASRRCIAFEGRLVVVGFTSGRIPDVPAGHVLVKNYSVVGLHWGLYRSKDRSVVVDAHAALGRLYADGKIRPLVSERVAMADAPQALTRLATRATVGKVVVLPR